MDQSLWEAYERTVFRAIVGEVNIGIRPGHREPPLDRLLERRSLTTWAFITAWNPGSRLLTASDNAARQSRLRQDLNALGYEVFTGEGQPSPDSSWTAQQSLLILCIPEAEAIRLRSKYGQATIVIGVLNEPARLISCEPAHREDAPP